MRINSVQPLAPKFKAAINLSPIWEKLRSEKKEDRVILSETQDQWIRSVTSTMGQDDALVLEVCPSGGESAFWVNGEERQLCENMFNAIENLKKTMPESAQQMACKLIFFLISKTTSRVYEQKDLDSSILGVRFFKNGHLEKEC
jgi:hypothetical protein